MPMLAPSIYAKSANELADRFARMLKFKKTIHRSRVDTFSTKTISLFIRSGQSSEIDITILITHDDHITEMVRRTLNERVTPLILSVSTMPFVETVFDPYAFVFEQEDKKWSPVRSTDALHVFPLGESDVFGGKLSEQDVQRGVIILPPGFEISKKIRVIYKNYKKMCLIK